MQLTRTAFFKRIETERRYHVAAQRVALIMTIFVMCVFGIPLLEVWL